MEVSRLHDWLGNLIDTTPGLLLTLGRMEKSWLADRLLEIKIDRPIYVTGLARSGSTILLELLAAHPSTATHLYRDYPFIHTPVWWNWFLDIAENHDKESIERAHMDGIHITPESPEAMEEVLWTAFFPSCHEPSSSNIFHRSDGSDEFKDFYTSHLKKLLLLRNGTRYLAKGNYNISRLQYIHFLFPDARFIIPVRDPVWQTASLMKQHMLFCDSEAKDKRVLMYMRRSGHFEFGLDRRPINLGCNDTVCEIKQCWEEGQEIRGWAMYWAAVYDFVADLLEKDEKLSDRCMLVHYDDLCEAPLDMLKKIYAHCELDIDQETLCSQARLIKPPTYYSHNFSNKDITTIENEAFRTHSRIKNLTGS